MISYACVLPLPFQVFPLPSACAKDSRNGARWCEIVRDGGRWCDMVTWCDMVRDGARWCQMVRDGADGADGACSETAALCDRNVNFHFKMVKQMTSLSC